MIRSGLLVLALALLAGALVNPRIDMPDATYRTLLVFDITQSMNVADLPAGDGERTPPTRLEYARNAARAALQDMPCGAEVGIGLFTGHRTFVLFVPTEVCSHFNDIAKVVDAIDWRMAWAAKSEVAKGLHSGLVTAKLIGEDVAVAFVTDGHEAPPISPLYPPSYRGEVGDVRGLVIGVGGATPVPIPKLGPDGSTQGVFAADEVMQIDVFSAGRDGSVSNEQMTDGSAAQTGGTEHLSSLRGDYLRTLADGLRLGYASGNTPKDFAKALRSGHLAREVTEPMAIGWMLALAGLVALALAHFTSRRYL